ncbi:MAG: hypothetical protein MMC33_003102 [Icmadophila ericetorum]|nr:hypothetical protein [Icmadophila ericetorum]
MASPLPSDPYKALGVPKDATTAQIKQVYRKLVLTCHPDKVKDESAKAEAADRFHQVQQAYEILADDQKRKTYDERVKLAELRRNILQDISGSTPTPGLRRATTAQYPTRSDVRYEMRGATLYEERAPRYASQDDSDYFGHESAKKYDERYHPIRRSSTRGYGQEERRKARDRDYEEDERARSKAAKAYSKIEEEKARNARKMERDRERRTDQGKRFARPTVESDSDSDSDSTERFMAPKKSTGSRRYYEEPRRETREDAYRRRSSKEQSESEDDQVPSPLDPREHEALSHMARMGDRIVQRPSLSRVTSSMPQPPTPPLPVETPRRSSAGRTRGSGDHGRPRSSGKDRSHPTVSENREYDSTPSRRPHFSASTTEPPYGRHSSVSPKEKHFPTRAATFESPRKDSRSEPKLQRSATQPSVSRNVEIPIRSSKLKPDYHDSGYSSPGTPEYNGQSSAHGVYTTHRAYRVNSEEDDKPRVVLAEPSFTRSTDRRDRERDISPRNSRHHPEHHERPAPTTRPSTSSNVRGSPQIRSTSFAHAPEPSPRTSQHPSSHSRHGHSPDSVRPPLTTSASRSSARGGALYGEVTTSPPITAENIRYSPSYHTSPREMKSETFMYPDSRRIPDLGRGASYKSAKVGS